MKETLSLEQELRAVRIFRGKNAKRPSATATPVPQETGRPWQQDIDTVQQTMQEVLRTVANLSGVELPGAPHATQDGGTPLHRLEISTLKDRIRNDLEGYSLKTTAEVAKQARRKTEEALDEIKGEIGGRIEQVAAEFRENLQLPAQMEKLLEPCVEDAEARLQKSLSQKVENLLSEQDQLAQEKLRGALTSVQTQISTIERTLQEIREIKPDSATQVSAEPPAAILEELLAKQERMIEERLLRAIEPVQARIVTVEDLAGKMESALSTRIEHLFSEHERLVQDKLQDVLSSFQNRINTTQETAATLESSLSQKVERMLAEHQKLVQAKLEEDSDTAQTRADSIDEIAARLESSLSQKMEHLLADREQSHQDRLQQALSSVQGRIKTAEEATANLRNSLSQKVDDALAEQRQIVQQKLQEVPVPLQPQIVSVEEVAVRVENSLSRKVEQLFVEREKANKDRLQQALISAQAQIATLEQAVQKICASKDNPGAQTPVEETTATVDGAELKDESSFKSDLNGFLDQAFSRIQWSFKDLLETRKLKQAKSGDADLEELRKALPSSNTDMLTQVKQALDNLDRLGPKDPACAS